MAERKPPDITKPHWDVPLGEPVFQPCPQCGQLVCIRVWRNADAAHAGPWWETLPAPQQPASGTLHPC